MRSTPHPPRTSSTRLPDPSLPFEERVRSLPQLGLGISTEFGARGRGLDLSQLQRDYGELVRFLEIGVDLERGVDEDARAWIARDGRATYHFLDLNLEEAEDLDPLWVRDASALARELGAVWLCGDAGLWHVGPRERGHGVLLPPVLEPEGAEELADNVRRLRMASGFEVLPENPPAHVYLGRLHLLDYFARVAERADCGLLLDLSHLAIFQRTRRLEPLSGIDGFPLERVVELHVAGGTTFEWGGRSFVDDDHGTELLPEVLPMLESLLPALPNLRALVFEGERNPLEQVLPVFRRLEGMLHAERPE